MTKFRDTPAPFRWYSCFFLCLAAFGYGRNQPNIVFIFSDDQSYETVHAHGNEEIQTPHLDRLASNGVSFLQAYNMGAWHGAICVASRTMLQTGRTVWRAKQAEDDLNQLADAGELWPQLLGQGGYETYMSGKWHVEVDPSRLFDHVKNVRGGMPNQTDAGYLRPVAGQLDPWSPYAREFGGFWSGAGGKHLSEILADDATAFIEEASRRERPFFMYLAFNAPHDPRQAPKRFVDLYPQENVAVPANFLKEYPFKQEIGCYQMRDRGNALERYPILGQGAPPGRRLQRDEALAPWPRTEFAVRTHRSEYYAAISYMDEQIGRILAALDASGKMENTIVVFTSDHGLACGHHGLMGKQNMYEHSLRVPFVVSGPGIPRGETREMPIYLQDVVATTLSLAGVEKPDYVEFNDIMPLVENPAQTGHYESIYGAYETDRQRMIRVGEYKLIVYPQARRVRLFNLDQDPNEVRDLASDPSHWPRIRELFGQLVDLQQKMEDELNLAPYFPELASR